MTRRPGGSGGAPGPHEPGSGGAPRGTGAPEEAGEAERRGPAPAAEGAGAPGRGDRHAQASAGSGGGDAGSSDARTQDAATAQDLTEALEGDIEQIVNVARRERDEYLDMLRRVQADFENYKKRMMRQQTDLLERAAQGLIDKLLPALDAFELARAHLSDVEKLSDEGKALLQASALLFDTLGKEGLERVDDLGKPFDPTTHDAVEHESSDAPEAGGPEAGAPEAGAPDAAKKAEHDVDGPVVTGVLRPGYRWKGRVLRPALVRVRG